MRNKTRSLLSVFIILLIASLATQTARAGKFHFNSINFSLGGSLLFQGTLVGLGNEEGEVTLLGFGEVTALCENNGGKQAPGRNPIVVSVVESGVFNTNSNGRALVEVIAPDPEVPEFAPSPTPKQAGCPNGNWNVVGIVEGSTNWTGAEIIVRDEAQQVRIHQTYNCTTFFEDGVGVAISCEET
jgi:hypothetical protein